MAGIFISHSSKDKPFVTKLAMDLVSRDIPVWFDSWELETGDSLIQRIYSSIDTSTYLLVVLSASSVDSKWVEKELTAALVKEEQINKRFVIPIKIDQCHVPLSVADRLYADFSDSYLGALESLTATLKKLKADQIDVPSDQQLIPVTFSKGIYLRELPFEKRVTSIFRGAPAGFRFSENQFVLSFDDIYLKLRERLIRRMENIEEDPFYTPEFERSFAQFYESLFAMEDKLIKGISLILNEGLINKRLDDYLIARACHWFARIMRSQLYYLLYACQIPNSHDLIEPSSDWTPDPTGYNHGAAKFFGIQRVDSIDFGPPGMRISVRIWVDEEWEMLREWRKIQVPLRLKDYLTAELIYKYIVPQMVDRHLRKRHPAPLLWDFQDYDVGLS